MEGGFFWMWLVISRFLLIELGVAIGIAIMYLFQVSKQVNEQTTQMKRRNKEMNFGQKIYITGFKQCPITGIAGNRVIGLYLRFQT